MQTLHTKTLHKLPSKKYKGFTLVELIVVITILVILGTIAFIQLQGFSGSARDSARIENLSNLQKGLTLFQIKSGTYPLPENPVNITASGTIIGYQGFAKDQIGSIAKLSKGGTIDPLDPTMYTTYSVNTNQTKMQLMTFLEDGSTAIAFVPTAFASISSDYSKRSPIMMGDSLGILLGNSGGNANQPVQELYVANSFTGVDVMNTTGSYTMQFDKNIKISGTGMTLKAGIAGGGLVGYWDMDSINNMQVLDISGKGNNLKIGTGSLSFTGGKLGNSFYSTGGNCLTANISNVINQSTRQITISAFTFSSSNSLPINSNEMPFGLYGVDATTGSGYPFLWWHKSSNLTSSGFILFRGLASYYQPDNIPNSAYQVMDTYYPAINDIFDKWHLDTIVLDGYSYTYYQDGVRLFSKKITNYSVPNNINMTVGCGALVWGSALLFPNSPLATDVNSGWNYKWYGQIDELRIYNRALSDSEIQVLYNSLK